ncbi:phosphoribosyl-ATP pyrophosphatase [Jiangella alba]|uniref:Phosphoribosyl-ATP pyrophosphatase n=1 Tax=Jiangella alba TaxID=561176 RepID=A0A1H5KIX6_9ACTN|nr:phosphoribosyl-ATP pyrophosphatase [Jiangella alba]
MNQAAARGTVSVPLCDVKSFEDLWVELSAKVESGAAGSGTVEAVRHGVHHVGKKVVEEAAEAWMAAEHESTERAAEEISQLLYHVQVLMLARGITLADVYERL